MKKSKIIMIGIVLLSVLMLTTLSINAKDVKNIGNTEIIQKSLFFAGEEINNDGTIRGDLFAGAKIVASSGIIQGDLIAGGENVLSSGTVTGDILCGASSVDITGIVGGDIRCGGTNVSIDGNVGKNVNAFAETTQIKRDTQIGGNLLAFGSYIRIDGKVKGYTKLNAHRITLNGEFFGDVDINMESSCDDVTHSHWNRENSPSRTITILPGTVIHGKLTYKSPTQVDIPTGAVVKDYQWIKSTLSKTNRIPSPGAIVWSFIKMLLATAVYFLIAMLLWRLFPKIFMHLCDTIHAKPLQAVGLGLVGVLSIIAGCIGLIILILISILFNALSLSFVIAIIMAAFFVTLFYLATIPVALWLGNLLFKERFTLPARFALGLGIISLILFIIDLLSQFPAIGALFGFINFVVILGILLLGTGALLKMARKVIGSVQQFDPEVKSERLDS